MSQLCSLITQVPPLSLSVSVCVFLLLLQPVVLPGGVRGVRYLASERGRRLGAVVDVGGVQQDLWGRCVLLHEAL